MAADLQSLCRMLRAAGYRLGVDEELRLAASVEGLSVADGVLLRDIVAAIVLKSPASAVDFDRIYGAWLQATRPQPFSTDEPLLPSFRQPAVPVPLWQKLRHWFGRYRRGFSLGLLTLLIVAGLGIFVHRRGCQPTTPESADLGTLPVPPVADAGTIPIEIDDGERLAERFTASVPHIEIQAAKTPPSVWLWWGLALLSAVGLGAVLVVARRRRLVPEPAPLPSREGLPCVFPTAHLPKGAPDLVLTHEQSESVVWGIERFVSEEASRRLDLPATIAASSAAGGRTELRFQQARYPREVWIWLDRALGSRGNGQAADIEQFLQELTNGLTRAGLPVERATFWGLPERLSSTSGKFLPSEVDERRNTAMVVVYTDGRLLQMALQSGRSRVPTEALLRQLSHFPQLAFVDCGEGAYGLSEQLGRFQILVLSPGQVPSFLGGRSVLSRPPAPLEIAGGESRAWAAACALAPYPLSPTVALALRQHLGLGVSPWLLRAIVAEAVPQAGRFVLPPDVRAQHLRWLCDADDLLTLGKVPPASLLGRTLQFFRTQLTEENKNRLAADAAVPWRNTPAEQNLLSQQALLELWDAPQRAVAALYSLHGSGQRDSLTTQLALCVPLNARDLRLPPDAIVLPWRWHTLSPTERALLVEMGFGRAVIDWHPGRAQIARPPRIWMAASACAGLLALTLASAAWERSRSRHEARFSPGPLPEGAFAELEKSAGGKTFLVVGTARHSLVTEVPLGSFVKVSWSEQMLPCRTKEPDGREVWRCGTVAQPIRPLAPWPRERQVWLLSAQSDAQRRALATGLLDSGSADVVVLHRQHPTAIDLVPKKRQVWVLAEAPTFLPLPDVSLAATVQGGDFAALATGLRSCKGRLPAQKVWGQQIAVASVHTDDSHDLRCLDNPCPYREWTDPKSHMVFVRVCGGEFEMGSAESDKDAGSDEKPAHRVKLSPFWMGKYEVSNAEYRQVVPTHHSTVNDDSMPVTDVSWRESKQACEALGHRLPTEAEWEYAARGMDGRKYPWGNEEPTDERARFSTNLGDRTTPESVQSRPSGAGPFGTLHQAGNVWEWVSDCYQSDSYLARELQMKKVGLLSVGNPVAVEEPDCRRVVRGGSFVDVPGFLRCAVRFRVVPEVRNWVLGFRCVRGGVRQP